MPAGVRKENGGEILSRWQSQGALWKSVGRVPGREDERSPHLLKERPERSGSPAFMHDHPAYVFKFRFLALVPQASDSESWGGAQERAFSQAPQVTLRKRSQAARAGGPTLAGQRHPVKRPPLGGLGVQARSLALPAPPLAQVRQRCVPSEGICPAVHSSLSNSCNGFVAHVHMHIALQTLWPPPARC